MKGNTESAREAAEEMTNTDVEKLRQSLVSNGAFETVVEGGFHSQALIDTEADFLTEILIDNGVNGLRAFANGNGNDIALITPLKSTGGPDFEEIIARLDDGNEYPGFKLDYEEEGQLFRLSSME